MTNGDHIRSMTDEELANFIAALLSNKRKELLIEMQRMGAARNIEIIIEVPYLSKMGYLKWLKEPAKEERP